MVAVRVDIYGIFYACVIGLLLLIPRKAGKVWVVAWCIYLVLHGFLLVFQYVFLLGIPEADGYCLTSKSGKERSDKFARDQINLQEIGGGAGLL